ncbi:MAG: hypothetical protein CMJ48_14320 [Planctomycetaceae bacterium]|nr:hypothetical protein [Planctomycetaceae bacterium]
MGVDSRTNFRDRDDCTRDRIESGKPASVRFKLGTGVAVAFRAPSSHNAIRALPKTGMKHGAST